MRTESALQTVDRVLSDHRFVNPDIGPLNAVLATDCFVISAPKCGTTALQRGLDRAGRPTIHAHTDGSTFEAFGNGDVLRDEGLGMGALMRARRATSARPMFVFFGYRDPISWYISMVGQFGLPMDERLELDLVPNIETRGPWNRYRVGDVADIVSDGVGLHPRDVPFDPEAGLGHAWRGGVCLVLFRIDRLPSVAAFIRENVAAGFVLTPERVNLDPGYIAFRDGFRPTRAAVEHLARDGWFRHFYAPEEIEAWRAAYLARCRD